MSSYGRSKRKATKREKGNIEKKREGEDRKEKRPTKARNIQIRASGKKSNLRGLQLQRTSSHVALHLCIALLKRSHSSHQLFHHRGFENRNKQTNKQATQRKQSKNKVSESLHTVSVARPSHHHWIQCQTTARLRSLA